MQDHIARWQNHWTSVQDLQWKPDADVSSVLAQIKDEPVLWLSTAVNVMAFVSLNPPQRVALIELLARKAQAGRALCNAARQGCLTLIGTSVRGGDGWEPIERAYFDVPRFLGDDENSIITDMSRLSDEAFLIAQQALHTTWFNVRVEARQFASWLAEQTYSADKKRPLNPPMPRVPGSREGMRKVRTPKTRAWVAEGLRVLYPNGEPLVTRDRMIAALAEHYKVKINAISPRTLDRARKDVWPD